MVWIEALEIGKALIFAGMENDAKHRETKIVLTEIQKATTKIIETIENQGLVLLKGDLVGFYEQFERDIRENEQGTSNTDSFITLSNTVGNLKTKLDNYFKENDITFFTTKVYPVYVLAVSLQISVFSEIVFRFKKYVFKEHILKQCIDEFLKTHHLVEEHLFNVATKEISDEYDNNIKKESGGYWKISPYYEKMVLNEANRRVKELVNFRELIEMKRYKLLINLNSNFEIKETEDRFKFGEIDFSRCTNYSLMTMEDKTTVLSVNDFNGDNSRNPSIFKVIEDIPRGGL